MPNVTMEPFGKTTEHFARGAIDWANHDIRVLLLSNSYTPDQANHDFLDDVVAAEVSGTGYTAGGVALASKTVAYASGTKTVTLDAADTIWSTVTVSGVAYVVVYNRTPATNATRHLIALGTIASPIAASDGTLTIVWPAAGILTIDA